jgi:BirA family transcriptional regulator, biotin operon repressor / biotin---[acetyl-CoA-carboxylase] ligase
VYFKHPKNIKLQYTPPPYTRFIGQHIVYQAACASTNSLAIECWHQDDFPEGAVVITDHQYRGRGQRGHVWHSQPNKNLTFSAVLYPTFLSARQGFSLNMIITLAIQHVLALYIPSELRIKWPNDIYYQDKKLGGVLIENVVQKQRLKTSVIGIGLNVNQVCFTFQGPTSLSLICQRTFSLQELLAQILTKLECYYLQLRAQDIASLKAAYLKDMYWIHEVHTFQDATHTFPGVIKGVDTAGKLIIEHAEGTSRCYNMQEVKFIA